MRCLKSDKGGGVDMRKVEGNKKGIVEKLADSLKKEGINAEVCLRMDEPKEQVQS